MALLLTKDINIIPKDFFSSFNDDNKVIYKITDKFNIIQNDIEYITNDELTSLIDNYFENIIYSNGKVIHSDLISQILWFRKDFDYSQIILRHLENYLKEKKIAIRNSIKKGVFDIESGLNSLIKNYFDKIYTSIIFVSDNKNIISFGLTQLYNQIITDPPLLVFLKAEISSLDENNVNSIIKLTSVMKTISDVNPDIKSYNWFLFLISSSFGTVIEENNNISYPVPENHKQIINFRKNLSLYQKIQTIYSFVGNDIHIILNNIVTSLFVTFIKIMKTCSILELYYLVNNYKKVFESIFSHENILIQNKNIKDIFTNQFLIFIVRIEKEKNIKLENIVKCFQTVYKLFTPSGISRDFIIQKISGIFSNESSQNYLLNIINRNINTNTNINININININTNTNTNTNTKEILDIINQGINTKIKEKLNDSCNIISFCAIISNKDIFIERYNKMLINRILYKPNILNERAYYKILEYGFGTKLTYKTNKILTDMESTLQDKEEFNKVIDSIKNQNKVLTDMESTLQDKEEFNKVIDSIKNQNKVLKNLVSSRCYDFINKMNVITSSYNNWDINQIEGIIGDDILTNFKSNYIIANMMEIYNKFYEFRYENKRKLNWYPHFGEIVFDFNEIEFKMLPIQFMILEHINKIKEIHKDDLINFPILFGYNNHFIKSIISSLLLGQIIKLDENKIKINLDNTTNITTNYIDLFFTSSGYTDIWNNRREQELVVSREEVLSSWINHFLKKESYNKTDLFYKIKKSIDLFDFNIDFLDKVINDMIIKDYIKYNGDKIEKIIW